MTDQHTTTVISVTLGWPDGVRQYGYRAVCAGCRYRSRGYPLAQRAAAEAQAEQHQSYHRDVARITGQGEEGQG